MPRANTSRVIRPGIQDPEWLDAGAEEFQEKFREWNVEAKEDLHAALDDLDLSYGISVWSVAS